MAHDPELMSMAEFVEWMAARGVVKSRRRWTVLAEQGRFGHKLGTQWVVTIDEAKRELERERQRAEESP